MADGIKIGNLDISAFKVGSSDCKVYLGDVKLYPQTPLHEYVEIGGVKWATMNVGATSVTDTGLYFQWGDISGYTASQVGSGSGQKYFGWADYKYCSGAGTSSSAMTKYNSTDGKTVLEASDDAAVANWGSGWKMPTEADFQTLLNAVNTAWTADYQGSSVAGMICTDKTDSSKVLFFPACGYCSNGGMSSTVGSHGYYWSSYLNTSNVAQGRYLHLYSGNCNVTYYTRRCGFPVRGILGE